jgi:Flp pilus assembly protein TadG
MSTKLPGNSTGAHRGEEGQALVETAIAFSLLLLILLGGVEFARLAFAAIAVSNSARAAAQYACMNGGASADTTGITTAAQQDTTAFGPTVTATVIGDTCQCSTPGTGTKTAISCTDTTLCASPAHIMETVTVQTSAQYTPLIRVGGFPSSFALKGWSQQMVLR